MELIRQAFPNTPESILWVMVIVAITAFVFLFTRGEEKDVEAKVEDLFKRACEVSHSSWFVHSIQSALNDGVFVILKNDNFPYLKEDLDVPSSHPDFRGFESLREGDYVSLVPTRDIQDNLPHDRLSTFLRLAGLAKVA